MSSESSMSSGSRIRQFGLYRTIDARTEEFLRLSRRRQIRQGCACAAVSTAITVTIVVVVFIVYEFSLNSEINLDNSLKSNWFNLMNLSSDGNFETSLTKNVDPTTLQLLPMLIKALKKNVILEKVLEEHSSSSPLTDKKHTTDDYYSNQVFTNNWLKMPTSKLYAIEYKTSPVVYFRNPTKSIELFTKIRKVRDYQRIVNYIDKMISEKVYVGSTKPMIKGEMYTYSHRPPVKSKIKHTDGLKSSKVHRKTNLPANYNLRKVEKKDSSCKCPKNISMLLQKFLDSIQKVIPLSTTKTTSESFSSQLILQKPVSLEPENVNKLMATDSDNSQKTTPMELTKNIPKKTESIRPNCNEETTQSYLNHTPTENDYLVNSIPLNDKKEQNIRSTTINNVVEGTVVEGNLFPTTTKPVEIKTQNTTVKITTENIKYFLSKYYSSNLEENTTETDKPKETVGLSFNDTDYDDEFDSTTPKDNDNDFVNKLRSIKSKTVPNKRFRQKHIKNNNIKSREFINDNNDVDQESSSFLNKLKNDLYHLIEQNAKQMRSEIRTSEDQSIKKHASQPKSENMTNTEAQLIKQNARRLKSDMTTSQAPSFATSTETQATNSKNNESVRPNTEDFDVKLLSSQIVPLDEPNLRSVTEQTEITWEHLKNVHFPKLKSMIPVDRPVYLEFHRNDWKHEDPIDFDYNINTNIYDMPNN